jgi:thiamine phosphate synthase YjbQ (UPF0047 family)
MIQENWDESVQQDVIDFLSRQIPKGVWKHDAQEGNPRQQRSVVVTVLADH